ncbi:MAG: hypothetical protein CMJ91_11475 [Planctomycetes bacterium]|nr:hypothetical protein [Planctomycetota bacterium]|tara:strand:- start:188 stop:439 length:252 start_codon:yes stop_codon:yes gene_type:complete
MIQPAPGAWRKEMSDRYKFFGEIALEKRFVSAEQLYEALTLQARNRVDGVIEKQLGQLLLELGHISEEQISEVLDVLYPVTDT